MFSILLSFVCLACAHFDYNTKWETGLFYLFFESSDVERKFPSWDVEAFTAHTEFMASPGPGAQAAHHQTEMKTLPESHFWEKKEKIKRAVGEGDILWSENTNAPSRIHNYKLIENINISIFGAKSKHPEELK